MGNEDQNGRGMHEAGFGERHGCRHRRKSLGSTHSCTPHVRSILKLRLDSLRDSRKVVMFVAKLDPKDLVVLTELIEAGKVTPVIDRCYELSKTSEAFAYLGEGHAGGKVVVTIENKERPCESVSWARV